MLAALATAVLALQAPASFKNIVVAQAKAGSSFQPCEPSIAINPKNPDNLVAGVILDRAIYTKDAGKSWGEVQLRSAYGVFGDPVIIADHEGRFYMSHLSSGSTEESWLDRIVCQASVDGGATWNGGVGMGLNPPADQDKQWKAAHPTERFLVSTWTQFDKYGSKEPRHTSNIYFSSSSTPDKEWTKAVRINDISGDCLDSDNTAEGAVPAIGTDGTVYVAWSMNGILFFDRSSDRGKTWLPHDRPIGRQFGGWDMDIPGLSRCNGMPVLMIDNSDGPHKNSLYVVYADQIAGENDTDIFLIRSRDRGDTWSAPKRINQDGGGKHQFLPWLSVDPKTGYLYVVYYDRRAYSDHQTDVYVAFSIDSGETFREAKISERPFTPTTTTFFGDYNNVAAFGGRIAPIWTRMDGGRTSVWTAILKHEDLMKAAKF